MKLEKPKMHSGQCACGSWKNVTRRHGYLICERCYQLDYKTPRQQFAGVSEDVNFFTDPIDEYLVQENLGEKGGRE
jgi:hypothetical protein